jgi:uncharacterized membrane protein YfcA
MTPLLADRSLGVGVRFQEGGSRQLVGIGVRLQNSVNCQVLCLRRINAVGSSLVSVGAFGITTAATYALAGLIDWRVALVFVIGGIAGGLIGVRLSLRLAEHRGTLSKAFATAVVFVALSVLWKSSAGLFA